MHFRIVVIGSDVAAQLEPYRFREKKLQDPFDAIFEETGSGKWDQWEIGGRWKDFFILKNGKRATTAAKAEIDFEAIQAEHVDKIRRYKERAGRATRNLGGGGSTALDEIRAVDIWVSQAAWRPFAVVRDSGWYELGELILERPEEESKRVGLMNRLLGEIGDTTVLTVVDCHI
jgi:hypothetical protein